MICVLLWVYGKSQPKVYIRKPAHSLPIKLDLYLYLYLCIYLASAAEIIMKLEFSQTVVEVYINTALFGEQFGKMNLKISEVFVFVNCILPLLRLNLKK